MAKKKVLDVWETHEVTSTNIKTIAYCKEKQLCRVTFHKGGTWEYSDFPEPLWKAFKIAKSHGSFHVQYIKNNPTYFASKI